MKDDELKKKLSPEAYHVLREKGTECAFSGKYYHHKEKGIYYCAACGNALFSSEQKYESGTGWPSYFQPRAPGAVEEQADGDRTEVVCSRCKSHLGHVFPDGPPPTYKRYCINSLALEFRN